MTNKLSTDEGRETGLLPLRSRSPRDTFEAGRAFAGILESGVIVALYGDLGAGKTEYVRGICAGLGIEADIVTSPTFSIVNEYPGGRFPIFHFDVYRMKSIEELYELGYEDYFFGDGVTLVEWPSMIEELLPSATIRIRISQADNQERLIERVGD